MTTLTQAALILLLQSSGLLALGLLALRLTRGLGPAVQTLIGRASLVSAALLVLLLPLTGHVRPMVRVPEPNPPQAATLPVRKGEEFNAKDATAKIVGVPLAAPASIPIAPASQIEQTHREERQPPVSAPTPRLPAPGGPLQSHLLQSKEVGSLWLIVSFTLLLWLGICQCHLSRLRRTAEAIISGPAMALLHALTPHPPRLLTHPSVHSPFLAGYVHPVIFLPSTYEADFNADALRAILFHELAHRDRRDNLWTLAARLLTALLWPQPLLWLLVRHLEHISEDACDEAVLSQNCPPRAYADCLLSLATRPPLRLRERALSAGVAPFRSSVGRRISRIFTFKGDRPMSPITLRLRLTAAALTVAAALSGAFLVSSAPAQSGMQDSHVLTTQERQFIEEQNQDLQNLKIIGLALGMYERDNHYQFPDANKWMDEITPYLEQIASYRQDRSVFYDPFQPGKKRYGYALNHNCSGKPLFAFAAPSETVAVFDSTLGTRNASDAGASLRTNPALDWSPRIRISPAGSNYGYADGHAKFFTPEVHPSFSLSGGMPSTDGNDHNILGSWVSPSPGAAKTAFIFSSANIVEKIGPWPGDTRKLVHFYGRYNAHPTDLKYIFTRVWIEGKPMYTIVPEKHLVDYALSADGQTIMLKNRPVAVYHRSHTYTVHKPKGFLWI